ncbi:MAG: Cna B-type domain-containing protein, partial [Eggerthellaceae bacterium]|nr:Cna B-type domain-containing protein [Eggerthellaceae bacterium]
MEKIRRKTQTKRRTPLIKTFLVTMLATVALVVGGVSMAWAAQGDVPAHHKSRVSNGDGTYKIEMNVTGDADNETQEAGNVNVVIVYDVSQSMTNNVTNNSGPRRADATEKVVHDFLVDLADYQNDDKTNIQVSLVTFSVRANQVQGWTNNIVTDNNGLANRFTDDGSRDTAKLTYTGGTGGSSHNGTNWDHAMQLAQNLAEHPAIEGAPTFVIFFTDGAPTAQGASATSGMNPSNRNWWEFRDYYNAATTEANTIESLKDTTLFGIYAFAGEADLLDDLLYYANTGEHRSSGTTNIMTAPANNQSHNYGATEAADHYYNAETASALEQAVSDIFSIVVQSMGISSVSISDGTTNQVKTTSGEVSELLEVDESSYQYWISIPVVDNKFTRVDKDGNTIEYTVTDNNNGTCDVSWGTGASAQTVTVDGSVKNGQLKYEWKEANALYNYAPPAASLNEETGAVDWDLSSVGTLLDGVTYSYTFDVYPSQETYDMIAQLKNGTITYGSLDANIKKYLKQSEDGNDYTLETNTGASLSYKDTRIGDEIQTKPFTDELDPVVTTSSILTVKKNWDPISQAVDEIILTVTKDGDEFFNVTLNSGNEYSGSANISTGLMRVTYAADGETITGVTILDEGRDYTFAEMDASSFEWELDAEIVRPMLIDSATEISTLILIEDATKSAAISEDMGSEIFLQQGGKTYFKIEGEIYELSTSDDSGHLEATNTKRSHVYLLKAVEGDDPGDGEFEFDLTVNAAYDDHTVAVEGSGSTYTFTTVDGIEVTVQPDSKHEGYYIAQYTVEDGDNVVLYGNVAGGKFTYKEAMWFSIYDLEAGKSVSGLELEGWTEETNSSGPTGYYYAPTGTSLHVTMKESYSLRFSYVPTGTTYTFVEKELAEDSNYSFVKAEQDAEGTVDGQTVTGTVAEGDTSYYVTYTNRYELAKITVKKEWLGEEGDSATVELYQDGTATGKTAELNADNEWTYTFADLDSGHEYSVQETDPTTGYVTTYSGTADVVVTAPDATEDDVIEATVSVDGEEVDTVTLDADNDWTETVNVDYYNEDGSAKTVTVSGTGVTFTVINRTVTVTNNETTEVFVKKIWEGPEASATITLVADGTATDQTITLPDSNKKNEGSFAGLPKYNNDGTAIVYTVTEAAIDNYSTTGPTGEGTEASPFTFTNSNTETTEVFVKKIWEGPEASA